MNFRYDTYCGLFCGACEALLSVEAGEIDKLADRWNTPAEDMECHGCKSGKISMFCRTCKIKMCAEERELQFCSECNDFPCPMISDFHRREAPNPTIIRNNLEVISKNGVDAWISSQKSRWMCEHCGSKFSYTDSICGACGKKVYTIKEEVENMLKGEK